MTAWYRGLANPERYRSATKEVALDAEHSVTAVIACYRDAEAIPVMYRRLTETFTALGDRLRDHLRQRRAAPTTASR